jgi:hypothetical protein
VSRPIDTSEFARSARAPLCKGLAGPKPKSGGFAGYARGTDVESVDAGAWSDCFRALSRFADRETRSPDSSLDSPTADSSSNAPVHLAAYILGMMSLWLSPSCG